MTSRPYPARSLSLIYRLLQQHLDKQAVGFPAAPFRSDIRFLKHLFTPDEAMVALHLSYKPASLEQIIARGARSFPPAQTERLLESMFRKGAIGWKGKDDKNHWFLLPMVIGMYECQDGDPTPDFLAAADAYMKTVAFGISFINIDPPQMRTIPIGKSISTANPVATHHQIREIIQGSPGPFVVLKCICREKMKIKGKPCKKTSREETCFALNSIAIMILRRGHGREISRDEAIELFRQSEADGLVLQTANTQHPEFVCSCCGCCCGMLSYHKLLPKPVDFWINHYQAEVATNACLQCGECVPRCQANAVSLTGRDGRAEVNLDRCIGCGLCVPTCPANAISLKLTHPEIPLPKNEEELYDEIMRNKKNAWRKWQTALKAVLRR